MIMIYDATLTKNAPKAVPAWMRTDNFDQLMTRERKPGFLLKLKIKR